MQYKISVVIICKNEEHIIGTTIQSAQAFADEIIVYDSGSTDNTIAITQQLNTKLIQGAWEGYGKTKQKAIAAAKNNWILNIDADEVLDKQLQNSITALSLDNEEIVYAARFKNFLGPVCLHWGEFGFDSHIRLFNRKRVNWDGGSVHEKLVLSSAIKKKILKGHILHYTMRDTKEFVTKSTNYALLNAEKYFNAGKKATWIKQYISPSVTFLKYYILRLGFLDGWGGLFSARMAFFYTYIKYARLHELWQQEESLKV